MSFTSGVYAVTTAGGGMNMRQQIEDAMTAFGGYTFVEEYNGWRVWKSPATMNGIADWFLFLRIGVSGTLVHFVAEGYNSSTHQFIRGGMTYGNTTVATAQWDAATHSVNGSTWYAVPNADAVTGAMVATSGMPPTSTYTYAIRVGTKHLLYSFQWGPSGQFSRWIGYFDTLLANQADDPVPLASLDLWSTSATTTGGGSNSWGVVFRMPAPFADLMWYYAGQAYGLCTPASSGTPNALQAVQFNYAGALGGGDSWGSPALVGPKFVVCNGQHVSDGRKLILRGAIPGLVGASAGTSPNMGDEFTVGGKTYQVVGHSAGGTVSAAEKAFAS